MDIDLDGFKSLLGEVFCANGLQKYLSEDTMSSFFKLAELLSTRGKSVNLTAITDPSEMAIKHFADCVKASELIPEGAKLVDVGCGAGFPTLPLAIVRPDLTITALDSTAKKIDFVNLCAAELSLPHVKGVCARAEDLAAQSREQFDVAVSRAVARLNIIAELCLPLVRKGGIFLAMKGKNGEEELFEAKNALKTLRATHENTLAFSLVDPKSGEHVGERMIFVLKKQSETPEMYPRNYSRIVKKPL